MPDFTAEKSENRRFLRFSVKPSHIGEGLEGVDVSFASFLCAKEKEGILVIKEKLKIKKRVLVVKNPLLFYLRFFHNFVMSSKVLPLVSGTNFQTKMAAMTQMRP